MNRLKKSFSIFLSFVLIAVMIPAGAFTANAALISGEYEFSLTANGEAVISAYSGTDTDIVIPSILETNGNKYSVASVDLSIYNELAITSITIPETVKILENITDLNKNHSTLTKINVSADNADYSSDDGALFDKEKTILYCFPNASSTNFYYIPDTVERIFAYAFHANSTIAIVNFGKSVKEIDENAFSNCTKISAVSLCDTLEKIGSNAFNGCKNLLTISIPASVTNIGLAVFRNCDRLVTISVDSKNTEYVSDSGVLFTRSNSGDKAELLAYPAGKRDSSYSIPDTVIAVVSYAFSGAKNLQSVTMGSSLTDIRSYAFSECSVLNSVTIGSRVSNIGMCAFLNCPSLKMIRIGNNVNSIGDYALGYYYVSETEEYNLYKDFTIYTHANTAAYQYAYNNNIKLVTDGDCSHIYAAVFNIVPPTCTKQGYTEYVCTYCGAHFRRGYVKANGHDESNWIVDKKATYTTTGKRHKVCDTCNQVTRTETIPVLKRKISACSIKLSSTSLTETGKQIKPSVKVTYKGKTLKKGVDYTVSYSSNVRPGIAAVTVKGIGKHYTSSKKLTFKIKPRKVKGFKVSSKKGTSVKLKWKSQKNITGYQIYMYNTKTKKYQLVKTMRGASKTSATISKTPLKKTLKKSGTYKFRIRAYKIVNSSKTVYGDTVYLKVKK